MSSSLNTLLQVEPLQSRFYRPRVAPRSNSLKPLPVNYRNMPLERIIGASASQDTSRASSSRRRGGKRGGEQKNVVTLNMLGRGRREEVAGGLDGLRRGSGWAAETSAVVDDLDSRGGGEGGGATSCAADGGAHAIGVLSPRERVWSNFLEYADDKRDYLRKQREEVIGGEDG